MALGVAGATQVCLAVGPGGGSPEDSAGTRLPCGGAGRGGGGGDEAPDS